MSSCLLSLENVVLLIGPSFQAELRIRGGTEDNSTRTSHIAEHTYVVTPH